MSSGDAAREVDDRFTRAVQDFAPDDVRPGDAGRLSDLFDSQAGSRHVDLMARELGARGQGFYSIGSAGHESNAAVAAALRPTDPALLHYRSGAFYVERARQVADQEPLLDMLHGIVAATADPISGGRHKVIGNAELAIIPQTSTIASHLPRSMGLAFSVTRARQLGVDCPWPQDAVVVCSFGDASANHSTAVGAINAAIHTHQQGLPLPLLFVCEDNAIGISVPTPSAWIEQTYAHRHGLRYFSADGADPVGALAAAADAACWVREHRAPAFLHLRTVRLMGHAGSDVESAYRSRAAIDRDLERDPLVATARALVATGEHRPTDLIERYEAKRREVAALADRALEARRLGSASEVMASIASTSTNAVAQRVTHTTSSPETGTPLTLAQSVNRALADGLAYDDRVIVFGEDVARKGGVYGVTRALQKSFGARRVFDTLLDEQSVLGTALGAGLAGLIPVPEIQYLAYLHNAADQIRGEASTLSFFSAEQYRNPMVVRIAGYAYQKGFGGHFHNDNGIAAVREIPGVLLGCPARPDDAVRMLRTMVGAARASGRVCVFLEPIALYMTKDLHAEGDGLWQAPYP
ncbi:MAG: thiamine pyrophosphate-dependent enzyme, partial [Nocardioidaceae bacterium]